MMNGGCASTSSQQQNSNEDSEEIEDYKSQPPDLSTANYSGQNQVNSIPQHMNMEKQNVGYISNQFQKVIPRDLESGSVQVLTASPTILQTVIPLANSIQTFHEDISRRGSQVQPFLGIQSATGYTTKKLNTPEISHVIEIPASLEYCVESEDVIGHHSIRFLRTCDEALIDPALVTGHNSIDTVVPRTTIYRCMYTPGINNKDDISVSEANFIVHSTPNESVAGDVIDETNCANNDYDNENLYSRSNGYCKTTVV